MKPKTKIIALLALLALCPAFAQNGTDGIFRHAHSGLLPSYTDYYGKPGEYEVLGPLPADDLDRKHGWSERVSVRRGADETVWSAKFVKGASWTVSTVDIKKPTDELFLGKYVGKPKADVLRDFPLGDSDTDRGFAVYYESDEFLITFLFEDGITSHINILTKAQKAETDSALPPADGTEEAGGSAIVREIGVHEIERVLSEYAGSVAGAFTLKIRGSFSPEEVTADEIRAMHDFLQRNPAAKITGAIEYVYFSGMHSSAFFYETRERLRANPDAYFCIDIGNSRYHWIGSHGFGLPENCFAGHENLCWLYAGSFCYEPLPENFCADCPNLKLVFMWDYGTVPTSAFRGAGEGLRIVNDDDGSEKTADEIKAVTVKGDEGWDYLAFTQNDFDEEYGENYKSRDESDKGWWELDDDEADPYADFPEELPPLPHEQLEEILDEIVMHEEHIIARGESGEPVELETLAYIYAHGNTSLLSVNEGTPYNSVRLKNPNPENGTPNLIAVMYARPTRENMRYFSYIKDTFTIRADERDLDYNSEEIAEAYKKINREPITWRTSVQIAGDIYEVFFTDIDDDQDEEDLETDYDMYDDEDEDDYDSLDAEEADPLTMDDYIALADAAIERERAGSYDADAEQDGGMYTRQNWNNRFFVDADFDGKAVYLSQTIKTDGGRNVIVIFCMKYSLGAAFWSFELGRHLESAEESDTPVTDEEIDEFVSDCENDHAYKTESQINGKAFTVYVVRGDE